MSWISLILSVLVLWVASLYKILHGSSSSSKAAFLNDGRRRNVLLVIVHPDDESMFFAPVINYLISKGHNLHILCISTGNADGMGSIRKEELYLGSAVLKIPTEQAYILDHPDLQDGFGKVWNCNLLASIIDRETYTHSIDLIITFDDYGISGHCNHCDVHQGVRKLLHDTSGQHLEAWELVRTNIVRKYIGPVDIWLSILFARYQKQWTITLPAQLRPPVVVKRARGGAKDGRDGNGFGNFSWHFQAIPMLTHLRRLSKQLAARCHTISYFDSPSGGLGEIRL